MRKAFILIGSVVTALSLALTPMSAEASCNKTRELLQSYLAQRYPGLNVTWASGRLCVQAPSQVQTPTVQEPVQEQTSAVQEPTQARKPVVQEPVQVQTPITQKPAQGQTPASTVSELTVEEQVVALVNQERAKEGLPALEVDATLQAAALARAKECVTLFSHTRPNGTSCFTVLKEYGISYRQAGENIAYGQRSPEEVVTAWMNSSGHRANVMNKSFTKIGIGYYQSANGTKYWSQLFLS